MNDADLPDLWVCAADLRFERIDGATPAWRTPGNGAVRYVPADRIVALEAELAERTRERDEARMHFSMVAMHFPDGDLTIGAVRRQAEEWLREHDAAERERREAAEKDAARCNVLCRNLAGSWFYGNWLAETHNERIQEQMMRALGWWPITEDELVARGIAIDAARKD